MASSKTRPVSLRLPTTLWDYFEAQAKRAGITTSDAMRMVLERFQERGGSINISVDDGSDKKK